MGKFTASAVRKSCKLWNQAAFGPLGYGQVGPLRRPAIKVGIFRAIIAVSRAFVAF
jgi:hypothetical protein